MSEINFMLLWFLKIVLESAPSHYESTRIEVWINSNCFFHMDSAKLYVLTKSINPLINNILHIFFQKRGIQNPWTNYGQGTFTH